MSEKQLYGIEQATNALTNKQIEQAIAHLCSTIILRPPYYLFLATPEEMQRAFSHSKFHPIPIKSRGKTHDSK